MKYDVRRLIIPAAAALTAGAEAAHAHGAEAGGSSTSGIHWSTWVLLFFCLLTAAAALFYWFKRRESMGRWFKALAVFAGIGAVLTGGFSASGMWQDQSGNASMNLIHIHGLAYEPDGSRIMVATHSGIKWFGEGKWSAGSGSPIDYMGFAPFEGGFYSSGHPGAGSKLPDPIGLVRSTDEGKTLQTLALDGQADFHLMAASYRKKVIYVYISAANTVLKQPGFYYTSDEGKTWSKCAMNGFAAEPTALAVHPDNGDMVAVGSRDGLYLSRDRGQTFEKLLRDTGISALGFDRDGQLSAGVYKDRPILLQLDPASGRSLEVPLPDLKGDALAYTGRHPSRSAERIISTYDQDVYWTGNGGETWSKLAENGRTKPVPETVRKAEKKTP